MYSGGEATFNVNHVVLGKVEGLSIILADQQTKGESTNLFVCLMCQKVFILGIWVSYQITREFSGSGKVPKLLASSHQAKK